MRFPFATRLLVVLLLVAAACGEDREARAHREIQDLSVAVNRFLTREGRLPETHEWPGFLLDDAEICPAESDYEKNVRIGRILDPWGRPYRYSKLSRREFEIWSEAR